MCLVFCPLDRGRALRQRSSPTRLSKRSVDPDRIRKRRFPGQICVRWSVFSVAVLCVAICNDTSSKMNSYVFRRSKKNQYTKCKIPFSYHNCFTFSTQVTAIQCEQLGVVLFKTDSLHCQVFLNPQHHQSLHLKLTQLPPGMVDQQKPVVPPSSTSASATSSSSASTFQWNPDDLHILERFFDSRVVMPPYRPSSLSAFGRLLTVPPLVLRDIIQIMRLELMPEILPSLKWHVQFCMRPPPSAVPVVPTAVVMIRQKILFFVSVVYTGVVVGF